jgi:DNA-nicking Smr family endonuclease
VPKKPSPIESALFRDAVGSVQTISSDYVLLQPSNKPRPYPRPKPVDTSHPLTSTNNDSLETLFQEDTMAFIAPGLQKNVIKKLRKGHFPVEADMDLHGLTSRQAQPQLMRFLQHCIDNGYRCAHIVHGKGYHSPDSQPVLKNDLNHWLRQHPSVQAFCSAPQRDGGSGAVLVLLKVAEKF